MFAEALEQRVDVLEVRVVYLLLLDQGSQLRVLRVDGRRHQDVLGHACKLLRSRRRDRRRLSDCRRSGRHLDETWPS